MNRIFIVLTLFLMSLYCIGCAAQPTPPGDVFDEETFLPTLTPYPSPQQVVEQPAYPGAEEIPYSGPVSVSANLRGVLFDTNGVPLANTSLVVIAAEGNNPPESLDAPVISTAVTGEDGAFILPAVPAGDFYLVAVLGSGKVVVEHRAEEGRPYVARIGISGELDLGELVAKTQ